MKHTDLTKAILAAMERGDTETAKRLQRRMRKQRKARKGKEVKK